MPQQTEIKIKSKSKLLDGLNLEQEKAVTHKDGPLLIVAGAGTGKTTVITRRIAYLIEQGVKPEEILALAFGEKAAGEMEERVDMLLPHGFVNVQISTFHAFGEQILSEYGIEIGLPDFKVLNDVGQWLLIRNNLDKFNLDYYRPLGNPTKFIKAVLSHFSRLKDELISPEEYLDYVEKLKLNSEGAETQITSPDLAPSPGGESEPENPARLQEIAGAYHTYNKILLDNSALDFGDLINYTLRLFKKRPKVLDHLRDRYKYILVDEFQDTNLAQYELVKLLAAPSNNITVVGDDDQSIFKFRGASISNIIHFQKDYPNAEFISLTDNYRSGQKILDSAYNFIQLNNPDRLEIKLKLSKKLKSNLAEKGNLEHLQVGTYLEEVDAVVNKITELMTLSNSPSHPSREATAGTARGADKDITFNDFAILARSHTSLEPFLNKFDALKIPYIYFANKGLYSKTIILDILSYFRLLDNYHETAALYRVLRFPIFKVSSHAIIELASFAKRKTLSLYQAVLQASALDIDDASREGLHAFLEFIRVHAETAKNRSTDQVFVQIVNDLHFSKLIAEDNQNANYLETFRRRILDFQNDSLDKTLKTFLSIINLEQEAGEEGDLRFDPEAGPEAVKLMTVHAAKGLEFSNVFVVGLVDKRFPTIERKEQIEIPTELIREYLPEGDFHIEEERRLFYVAMTRAKLGLFLTSAEDYGGKRKKRPSVFLHELGLIKKEKNSKATGKVELNPYPAGLPTGHLPLPLPKFFSFSQISLFKRCPLEYKYRYIMRLPTPGSGVQSFGITMHSTFEKFLRQYMVSSNSQDLFGSSKPELPSLEYLQKLYEQCWINDWYDTRAEREEFQLLGRKILREFYDESKTSPPQPKYLEKAFKLKLGNYYFTGKIDRADKSPQGLVIIDYKTGEQRKIADVDKQQLLVYQWAAKEALGEQVARLEYWYLKKGLAKVPFIGQDKDIEKLKADFAEAINEIVECTKQNEFLKHDQQTPHRVKCKYIELEL